MLKRFRWFFAAAALALLLAVPAVSAYERYQNGLRRARLSEFLHDPLKGDEGWRGAFPERGEEHEREDGQPDSDDPVRRMVMARTLWGTPTPETTAHLASVAHAESIKWSHLQARPEGKSGPGLQSMSLNSLVSGPSWANLGPTNANFEFNGVQYTDVDSGRPNAVAVNPTNPSVVYLATSGGGIWKTYNFTAGSSKWIPVTETLGNLAIGAMAMDPNAPDTLYAATGDFVDVPGGQILKTTDGGGSWSAPVNLAGTYPAGSGGLAVKAMRIRDLRVDPNNSNIVIAGTDVGLFRSTDGGATFSLIDLPNNGAAAAQVPESVWSVVYTGTASGASHWVVSGVYSCSKTERPPDAGYGTTAGATTPPCSLGNAGDIWTSSDSGATWSSRKAAGGLPALAVGRIALGAGATSVPASTVVYAQLGNQDEYNGPAGVGYWRSNNAGGTWTQINGTLSNRTTAVGGVRDCGTVNVDDQQAWYNQAIAVDPQDANNVVVGGMLCGLRTRNGLNASPTWDNVSHWLPAATPNGNTTAGTLPYVHADWHMALVVRLSATSYIVFAGTDGGLFSSTNLFDAAVTPPNVVWTGNNKGLVTHLFYSVASGDPADGNPYVAFGGLQDNGTRFRELTTPSTQSTIFNQVIGGDGLGAVAVKDTSSGTSVYWASVEYEQDNCVPAGANSQCNAGAGWNAASPAMSCAGDAIPFNVRYAIARASPTPLAVLTASSLQVFRNFGIAGWASISPCFTGAIREVVASPGIDGLYGVALSGGRFAVTSNCGGVTTACTWTTGTLGVDLDLPANGIQTDERETYTSSVSFPPTTPAGKTAGDVYLASTAAPYMADGQTLVPAAMGHLFITTDRGTTWTPLHGNGTGADLPNVGINAVRYDPGDLTNNTIWVGTQIGIYRSVDAGLTWQRYGVGFPYVSVTDLFISKTGAMLRAATYGRGLWEVYPTASAEKGVNGDGDYDRNLQIDGFDLGAMAARLGTSPATAVQPYYDWNVDMTGTVNTTDSADLTQLLTRFGDVP